MKKVGLLALALVMAVGGLGIGYAAWIDTITIDGTVKTGTVDVVVEYLSYVEVWKDLTTEGAVPVYFATDTAGTIVWQEGTVPDPGVLVASTAAKLTSDDTVAVSFSNLYPCDWFIVDIKAHCVGTVPVKINDILLESTGEADWVADLIVSGDIGYTICRYTPDAAGGMGVIGEAVGLGAQLEECDWIIIVIYVHIPQEDIYMAVNGGMTMTVDFVQWNEYPY